MPKDAGGPSIWAYRKTKQRAAKEADKELIATMWQELQWWRQWWGVEGAFDGNERVEKIVENNDMVTPNKEYSIPYTKGMLVIAFPNKDKDTELEFKYWIAPYTAPPAPAWW